jgi:hypothetical protein
MIEVLLSGDYRGTPHDVGAWAYAIRRGEELLGGGKGSDRPQAITSRLSAEAAALALALEEISRDWEGEDIVVRTTSVGLQGLLVRQGLGVPQDLARWYARARAAAGRSASVRILSASPEELASLQANAAELLPRAETRILVARASKLLGIVKESPL